MKTAKLKIILIFLFFGFAFSAQASEIIFQTPTQSLGVGDEFSVPIVLDSQNESVNAIKGDIVWSDDTLTAERVLSANSIVTQWIEVPHISGNGIDFAGIMPGGYESVINPVTDNHLPGIIATVVFRIKASGTGTLQFADAHLYKNDGLGTEASLQTPAATLSFSAQGSEIAVRNEDHIPPLPFTPLIINNSAIYDGKSALIFSTTDKQTGIDHYEVKEGSGDWIRAESPYLLVDQSLSSAISVKAIDLAGNFQIETIYPPHAFTIPIYFFILAMLIIIACILIHRAYVRHRKKKIKT